MNNNAYIMQLPPDRTQWAVTILKAFYREHNYIKPDSVKVVLRDGVAQNDSGGIVVKKSGLSFLVPLVIKEGMLGTFDVLILPDQKVLPLTKTSLMTLLASTENEDGTPIKGKGVRATAQHLPRAGLDTPGPIKVAADLDNCFDKLANLAKATGTPLPSRSRVHALMKELEQKEPAVSDETSIKVAKLNRYGELFEIEGFSDNRGSAVRTVHETGLTEPEVRTFLKEAGLEAPENLKERETFLINKSAGAEILVVPETHSFMNKEAAYLLLDSMSVLETTEVGTSYTMEKTADIHNSDLIAFYGNIKGTPVFTEPISVTRIDNGSIHGTALSSFKEFEFKKTAALKYPTKQGNTVFIPEDWTFTKVASGPRHIEQPVPNTVISRVGDMWFIKEGSVRKPVQSKNIDVELAIRGLSEAQITEVMDSVKATNKAVLHVPCRREKVAEAAQTPGKIIKPPLDLKLEIMKVAAALTNNPGVSEASIKQLLQIPAINEEAEQDLVEITHALADIKQFLSEYLLKYRLESEEPDTNLIVAIKKLLVSIEEFEQNIYMGS